MPGRKPGEVPKYTIGIGYVVAYRMGRPIEQIAKFFKVNARAVRASLMRHGIDIDQAESRKIKKLEKQIAILQSKVDAKKKRKHGAEQPPA